MSFDVPRVRGLYPTFGAGTAHLEGCFGALQPESVIRAIIATLRSSPAQPGSRSVRSQRTATSVLEARRAVADLVGATPDSVVLGASVATLMPRFAGLLCRDWQLGDEVVVSRLDADASLQPWLRAARKTGVIVRWGEVDLETGQLPTWQYEHLINPRTRIVTVPLANPATGAVPDIRAIADLAHRHGALVVVDAGAALPHVFVDLTDLGADLFALSAAKFGGPTVAAVAARPGLLLEMQGEGSLAVPQRFEVGPLPIELLDGLTAAVDHLACLDERATGPRRARLAASLTAAGDYERSLYERLDAGLRPLPGVTLLGTATDRLPIAALTVARHSADEVGDFLQRRGISVWTGPSGMTQLMSALGTDETGGAAYLGLMPHNTPAEVDQLIDALAVLAG
ncbi:MAG: aminotransferase class V-fold PLP-dependent enzyme [Jatrophihabitantaceae bacterium]